MIVMVVRVPVIGLVTGWAQGDGRQDAPTAPQSGHIFVSTHLKAFATGSKFYRRHTTAFTLFQRQRFMALTLGDHFLIVAST